MTDARGCEATTLEGNPCQAPAMAGSQFCWTHDPANEKAADAARGAPDPIPAWWPLENAAHARAGLAYVAQEVLAGNLPARDANAAAGAISALVTVLRATDLEARLASLERTLEHRGKS